MPTYVTPGAYFEAVDRAPRGVTAIRTDIAAFTGLAERGPLDTPTRVQSWEQFRSRFGGFVRTGYLAYAVKAFFENRGRTCYVTRVAAPEVTIPSVPQPAAEPPDRTSVRLAGSAAAFVPGAAVTAEQPATGSLQVTRVASVDAAAGRVRFAVPLRDGFDPHQPLELATGAGHARCTLRDAGGLAALEVRASSPGIWGNRLAVRISRASPAATRTAARAQPADGTALYVERSSGLSPYALLRITQERAGAVAVDHRFVAAVDPARELVTFDEPLDGAFDLGAPASLETVECGVSVHEGGRLREVAGGLSLHPDHDRFVERDDLGLELVTLALAQGWPLAPGAAQVAARLPVPGPALALAGGRDGLAGLRVADLTGAPGDRRGLRAVELVDEVAIVALPDVHVRPAPEVGYAPLPDPTDPCCPVEDEPEPVPLPSESVLEEPPVLTHDEIFTVQQRMVEHCEALRDRVAVLDAPLGLDSGEVVGWRQRFDTSWAALYYPWLAVLDPLQRGVAPVRMVPPSGHVCGVYARGDLTVGVHRAPANLGLEWVAGTDAAVDAATQGVLNPVGVNCVRTVTARGLQVYGARTLSSDPAWRYVNVRRLLAMIGEALLTSVQWAVFEPHDERLRRLLRLATTSFLRGLWQAGALAGASAEEAFFVRCDDSNNPPEAVDAGQVRCEVGVAPSLPAEFVIVRIGRTDNEWKIQL